MFQATVLEEMPPFPERESSILAKLKKKKGPGVVPVSELEDGKREGGELNGGGERGPDSAMSASNAVSRSIALVQITPRRAPPPVRHCFSLKKLLTTPTSALTHIVLTHST